MNSGSNGDSKQFLSQNWVGCTGCIPKAQAARTLRPGRALDVVSWRVERRIVAPGRRVAGCLLPYRPPPPPPPPPVAIQNCIVMPRPMPLPLCTVLRARPAVSQAVSQRCIAAPLCHNETQTVAPQPRYNFCIATHPWPSHARARRSLPVASRVASRVVHVAGHIATLMSTPTRTRSAVSWPGAPMVSRYDEHYRDQDWEMGSSLPSCQKPFFFHSFLFSLFQLLQDHKKKKNHVFSRTK